MARDEDESVRRHKRRRRRVKMTQQSLTRSSLLFLRQLAGHVEPIRCCAFNSNRHHVITACAKTLRLWTLQRELKRIQIPNRGEGSLPALFDEIFFFAREDLYLVICGGDPANASSSYAGYILGFHAGLTPALEFQAHPDAPIVASSFSQDTQELITCDAKGCVKIWTFRRSEDASAKLRVYHRGTFQADLGGSERAKTMTVVADLAIGIVASASGKLVVVDLGELEAIDRYDCLQANHQRANADAPCTLSRLVFDADAQHLLIGFSDGTVDLYCFYHAERDTEMRHVLLYMTTFNCHQGTVHDLCLIRGVEGALSCGADSLVRHWRPLTSAEVGRYQHVRHAVPQSSQVPANRKLDAMTTTRLVPLRLEVDAMCAKQLLMVIAGEIITVLEVLTPCLPFAEGSAEIRLTQPVPGPSPSIPFHTQLDRWKVQANRHHVVAFSRDQHISILDASSGKPAFAFAVPQRTQYAELEARAAEDRARNASAAPEPRHIPRLRSQPSALAAVSCYWWCTGLALHCIGWTDGKVDLRDSNADLKRELFDASSLAAIESIVVLQLAGPDAQRVRRIENAITPSFGYTPLRPGSEPARILERCDEDAQLAGLRRDLEASDGSKDPFLGSLTKKPFSPMNKFGRPQQEKRPDSRRAQTPKHLAPLGAAGLVHALVSGNVDGCLHMWSVEAAALDSTVQAHSGPVLHVSCLDPVHPDERIPARGGTFPAERCVFSAGRDGSCKLWSLPDLELAGFVQTCGLSSRPRSRSQQQSTTSEPALRHAPSQLSAVMALPKFGVFVCGHDNGFVQVFPLPSAVSQDAGNQHVPSFSERAHTKRVTVISPSAADPSVLLSASLDHGVMVWLLVPTNAALTQTRRLNFAAPITAACFTPICDEIVVTAGRTMSLISYWDKDGAATVSSENLAVAPTFEVGGKALGSSSLRQPRPGSSESESDEQTNATAQMEDVDDSKYPGLVPVQLDVLRAAFAKAAVDDRISIIPLESLPEVLTSLGWTGITWEHIQPVAARASIALQKPFLSLHDTLSIADVFMSSPEAEALVGPIRARSAEQLLRRDAASASLTIKKGAEDLRPKPVHVPRKYRDMCATRTVVTYNSLGEKSFPTVVDVARKISEPGRLHWDAQVRVDTQAPRALLHAREYRGAFPGRELRKLPAHFMHLFASRYGERAALRSTASLEVRPMPLNSVTKGIRAVIAEKIMLDALARDEGRPRVSMSRCVMEWHLRRFGRDLKMCKVVAERVLSFLNALRVYAVSVLPCRTLLCFVLPGPHRRRPSTANFFVDVIQHLLNRGVDYVPHLAAEKKDPPLPTETLCEAIRTAIPRQHRLQSTDKLADDLCEAVVLRAAFPQCEILEYMASCYEAWATFAQRRPSSPLLPSLSEPASPVSAKSPQSAQSVQSPNTPVSASQQELKLPEEYSVLLLKPRPLRMLSTFVGIAKDDHDHVELLKRRETFRDLAVPVEMALDALPDMHWVANERPRYMAAPDLALKASMLPRRSNPYEQVDPHHLQTRDFGRRGKRSIFVKRAHRDDQALAEINGEDPRRRGSAYSPKSGHSSARRSSASQEPRSAEDSPLSRRHSVPHVEAPLSGAFGQDDAPSSALVDNVRDDDGGDDDDDDVRSYQTSVSNGSDEPPIWIEGDSDSEPLFEQEIPKPGDLPPVQIQHTVSSHESGDLSKRGSLLLSPAGGSPSRRTSLFDQIMSPPAAIASQEKEERSHESREERLSLNARRRSSLLSRNVASGDSQDDDIARPVSRGATLSTSEIETARRSFRASFSLQEQEAFELKRRLSHNAGILASVREAEAKMPPEQLKMREASAKRIQAYARGFLIRSIVSSLATPALSDQYLDSLSAPQSSALADETHVSIPGAFGLASDEPQRSLQSRSGSPGRPPSPDGVRVLTAGASSIDVNRFIYHAENDPMLLQKDSTHMDLREGLLDSPQHAGAGSFGAASRLGDISERSSGQAGQDGQAALSRRASRSLFGRKSSSASKPADDGVSDVADGSRVSASQAMKDALLAPPSRRSLLGASESDVQGLEEEYAQDFEAEDGHELAEGQELGDVNLTTGFHPEAGIDGEEGSDLGMAGSRRTTRNSLTFFGSTEHGLLDGEDEQKAPEPEAPKEPALSEDLKSILRMNQYLPREHKRNMLGDEGSSRLRTLSNCFGEEIQFDPLTLMKQVSSIPHWVPSEDVDEDEDEWKTIESLDMRRDQNVAQGNLDFLYTNDDEEDDEEKKMSGASNIYGVESDKWTAFFKEMEALLQPAQEITQESDLDRQERKLRELKRVMQAEGMIDNAGAPKIPAPATEESDEAAPSSQPAEGFKARAQRFWKQLQHVVKIGSALRHQRKVRLEEARHGQIAIRDLVLGEPTSAEAAAGTYAYFRFVVPAASSFLTVSISSADGDPDLFLSNEAVPTLKDYIWRTSAIGSARIVLQPGERGYRAGVYVAGIYSLTPASFSVVAELQNNSYGCEELDHVAALTHKFNIIAVNPHRQSVEEVNAALAQEALREDAERAEEQAAVLTGHEASQEEQKVPEDGADSAGEGEVDEAGEDEEGGNRVLERRATFPQTRKGSAFQKEVLALGNGAMDDLFTTHENHRDDDFEAKVVQAGRREMLRAQFGSIGDEASAGQSASDRKIAGNNKVEDDGDLFYPGARIDSDAESISTFGGDSLVSEPVPHRKTRLLKHLLVFPKPIPYDLRKFHREQEQASRQQLSSQLHALEPKARCKAAFRGFKTHGSVARAIIEDAKHEIDPALLGGWLQELGVAEDGDPALASDYCRFERIVLAVGTRLVAAKRERMEERVEAMRNVDEGLLFPRTKSAIALGVGPRVGLDVAHLPVPRHPDLSELPNLAKLFAKSEKEVDAAQRRANKRAVDHIRRVRREKILREKLGDAAVAEMQKMGGW